VRRNVHKIHRELLICLYHDVRSKTKVLINFERSLAARWGFRRRRVACTPNPPVAMPATTEAATVNNEDGESRMTVRSTMLWDAPIVRALQSESVEGHTDVSHALQLLQEI